MTTPLIDCEDISNRSTRRSLGIENLVGFLIIFAGLVATWTSFGNDIAVLKSADSETDRKIAAIKIEQKEISKTVTETKLNVREIKANQEHTAKDVQRILTILESRE